MEMVGQVEPMGKGKWGKLHLGVKGNGVASGAFGEKGHGSASGTYRVKGNAYGVLTEKAEVRTPSGRPTHIGRDSIKSTAGSGLGWFVSGQGEVAAFCEYGNETSDFNRM
jgi:hypothetical protein